MHAMLKRLEEELNRTGATTIGVRVDNRTVDGRCVRISLDDAGWCQETEPLVRLLENLPDDEFVNAGEDGNSHFCDITEAPGFWDCNTAEDTKTAPNNLSWESEADWDVSDPSGPNRAPDPGHHSGP